MYIDILCSIIELDQLNSTSQGLPALLAIAAQLSKKEQVQPSKKEQVQPSTKEQIQFSKTMQSDIVSISVTNPLY